MNKKQVIDIFQEIAKLLKLQDENPFKVRSYEDAARALEGHPENLETLVESDSLQDIEGIGTALSEKIEELYETGELEYYENLRADVPEGLVRMLDVPGLGPKKIQSLHEELDITTLDELEEACESETVRELDGFGQKTEEKIRSGIENIRSFQNRFRINQAREGAQDLVSLIENHDAVDRSAVGGSLRRRNNTVGDVDILGSAPESSREEIMKAFVNHPSVQEVIGQGSTKASVRVENGLQIDLRLVSDDAFPYALHYFTGSKEHNVAMRSLARDRNLILNEYGLFHEENEERIPAGSEEDLFNELGLSFIPPEQRENMGEISQAQQENPFDELVTLEDIRGIFHAHTPWSDGRSSAKHLIQRCIENGYEYIGISDHSRTASYAGGLTIDELREQWDELEVLQNKYEEIDIYRGIESDILRDGSLDYPDDVLEEFDFVVASIHQQFQLPEDQQTERIQTAIRNPHTTFLGHPTGRRLLIRDGYDVDMEAILKTAGEEDTVVEINANPQRLDLDWKWAETARKYGVRTSINPDAHSINGLNDVRYGVGTARKGGWNQKQVVNTWSRDRIRSFLDIE